MTFSIRNRPRCLPSTRRQTRMNLSRSDSLGRFVITSIFQPLIRSVTASISIPRWACLRLSLVVPVPSLRTRTVLTMVKMSNER